MVKVICAGFPKTGTKTLYEALKILGMKHFEVPDMACHALTEWIQFMKNEKDFETVLDVYRRHNVDSFSDLPGNYFWEEFFNSCPKAKVILTIRDDENIWFKSYKSFLTNWHVEGIPRLSWYFSWFSGSMRDIGFLGIEHWRLMFSTPENPFFKKQTEMTMGRNFNEVQMKKKYRTHNVYVQSRVPSDQLLVFNVKDGWYPLCKFLEKPIPDVPFPRVNVDSGRDGYMDNFWNSSTFMAKCKKEALHSFILYILVICVIWLLLTNTRLFSSVFSILK